MRRAAAGALAVALAVAGCSLAYVTAPQRNRSPREYPSCSGGVAPLGDVLVGVVFGAAAADSVESDDYDSEFFQAALMAAAFFTSAVYGIRGSMACSDARAVWKREHGDDRANGSPVDHAYRRFRIPADAGPDATPAPDAPSPIDAGPDAAAPADAGAPSHPALEPEPPAPP